MFSILWNYLIFESGHEGCIYTQDKSFENKSTENAIAEGIYAIIEIEVFSRFTLK